MRLSLTKVKQTYITKTDFLMLLTVMGIKNDFDTFVLDLN